MVYKIIVSYKLFINVRNFIFNISHENRIEYYQSVVNAALVRPFDSQSIIKYFIALRIRSLTYY